MYHCQKCNTQVPKGQKLLKEVVKTECFHTPGGSISFSEHGILGQKIVKEIRLCINCYNEMKQELEVALIGS